MLVELPILQTAIYLWRARPYHTYCEIFVSLWEALSDTVYLKRYYQVIMTIDIFQYSNMYTLRKSIQWLADEVDVKEECGPYVTKPGEVDILCLNFFSKIVGQGEKSQTGPNCFIYTHD